MLVFSAAGATIAPNPYLNSTAVLFGTTLKQKLQYTDYVMTTVDFTFF